MRKQSTAAALAIRRTAPHGDILGFAPPLVISEAEVDEIVSIAFEAARQVRDELARERR